MADTVTLNDSSEAGDTLAVTVLTPPFSSIVSGVRTSVTTADTGGGGSSSSVILNVLSAGARMPVVSAAVSSQASKS